MHDFVDKYALQNNVQNKMQISFPSWPVRILILVRVSCDRVQVIFLFVHMIVTCE